MSDTSTEIEKHLVKKTKALDAAGQPIPKRKKKKKKVKAGSYNPTIRKGYEDMLKEADNY